MINFGRNGALPSVPENAVVHTGSLMMNLGSVGSVGAPSKKTLTRAEVMRLGEQVRRLDEKIALRDIKEADEVSVSSSTYGAAKQMQMQLNSTKTQDTFDFR